MCKTLNATSTCYLCKVHKTHASENVVGSYINMNIPALQEVSHCSIRFYCVAYFYIEKFSRLVFGAASQQVLQVLLRINSLLQIGNIRVTINHHWFQNMCFICLREFIGFSFLPVITAWCLEDETFHLFLRQLVNSKLGIPKCWWNRVVPLQCSAHASLSPASSRCEISRSGAPPTEAATRVHAARDPLCELKHDLHSEPNAKTDISVFLL